MDLEQVLDHILEQVERVVAGDAFSIMLVEGEVAHMKRWRGYESLGADAYPVGYVMSIADYPLLSKMSRTAKSVVVPATSVDPDWVPGRPAIAPDVVAELNIVTKGDRQWRRSYAGAPIQIHGETVGFLNVVGLQTEQFGPQDGQRLEAFASHAATAIENAQLYEQAWRDAETRAVLLSELDVRNQALEKAMAKVKVLSGLLPICASCKKIRDSEGDWQDVAVYIRDHSEADFTHSLCPECLDKLYPPDLYPYLYEDRL